MEPAVVEPAVKEVEEVKVAGEKFLPFFSRLACPPSLQLKIDKILTAAEKGSYLVDEC